MNTPPLNELLRLAKEKVGAMTPSERQAMVDEQARSWVRAEAGTSDAQELRERAYYREHGKLQDPDAGDKLRELLDDMSAYHTGVGGDQAAEMQLTWSDGVEFAIRQVREYLDTTNKND